MTDAVTAPIEGDNGAPATAAPAVTPVAAPTTPSVDWLKDADELTLGYTQNKGWKDPTEVVRSYQNLEKLLGADRAGNTVVLPKADASPEELSAFYNKLGRPADAKDYKLGLPEGADPAFSNAAAAKFHELGLSAKQAEELSGWYNQFGQQTQQQMEAQRAEQFQQQNAELRTGWGLKYDENVLVARNTVNALGLDSKTIDALEGAMGHKGLMEFLVRVGSKSGEADFVSGDIQSFNNAMTPAQAKAAIQSKMDDKTFVSKYLNKDADAVAEMQRLHKYAYPE